MSEQSDFCQKIFTHKHLDPECVEYGCKSVFLEEAVEELKRLRSEVATLRRCEAIPTHAQTAGELLGATLAKTQAELLGERGLRDELLAALKEFVAISEAVDRELVQRGVPPEKMRYPPLERARAAIAKANTAKTGAAQESRGERPISADAQTDGGVAKEKK